MEIRTILHIILPGGVLYTGADAEIPANQEKMALYIPKKGGKAIERIDVVIRKGKPAEKVWKFTDESVKFMLSPDSCTEPAVLRQWKNMSRKQRLIYHFKRLCEDAGGTGFTYEVNDN